ncbi:isochorismate synthase [Nesterenkonia sp.]|uniref:isochorismate synthase n=1 Tax=Nesterenkonia sp. TaxID=704201 RepID=UPI00260F6B33|nr:isochorismate synthase [Nesterenkonia sp.]
MTSSASALHAHTVEVDLDDDGLPGLLPGLQPSGVWLREGEGLVGLGIAAAGRATGERRFSELADWWETTAQRIQQRESDAEASPAVFASVAYAASSQYVSRLILPEVLLRRAGRRTWVTTVSQRQRPVEEMLSDHGLRLQRGRLLRAASSSTAMPAAAQAPGLRSERHYLHAVSAGLSAIAEGTVQKLVLARDVQVAADSVIPLGLLLRRLTTDYAGCWTYLVGGDEQAVLGATPEMLVSVRGAEVSSRVLAGTVDHSASEHLLDDSKQHHEHDLAVRSLLDQLGRVTETLQAPQRPRVLELPNVYHLASDITGRLARGEDGSLPSPLLVAGQAHPTAAVCGTPTRQADDLLAVLEGLDRGPFAGPVGWIDAQGNADFGIALRGGVLEQPDRMRLFAGCGIVHGSQPEAELAETRSKLRPMLTALGAG